MAGFNAGTIEAKLILDRSQFNRELKAAEADADRFEKKKRTARIGLVLDKKQALQDLKDFRDQLGRRKDIKVPIKIDRRAAERDLKEVYGKIIPKAIKFATNIDSRGISTQANALARSLRRTVKFDAELDSSALNKLSGLGSKSYDIPVNIDGDQAIRELQAIRGAIEGLRPPIESIDQGVDRINRKMGTFAKYAMIAGALVPPIAAGIAALPGLITGLAIPLGAVALGLEGIKAAAEPLKDDFEDIKRVVSAAFKQGLEPSIVNISRLIPTLRSGFRGTAESLSVMAAQITGVVASADGIRNISTIFTELNGFIRDMSPGMAGLVDNFIRLGVEGTRGFRPFAAVMYDLSLRWREVIDNMSQSGTAAGAVTQLLSVLGELLGLIAPLTQLGAAVMNAIGPSLVGALSLASSGVQALANVFDFLPGPIQTAAAALLAYRAAQMFMNRGARETARQTQAMTQAMRNVGMVGPVAAGGVRQVGDESDKTNKRVGGLRGAMGGLSGFLGGPWGVAFAAGAVILGVFGSAVQDAQQKQLEAKTAITGYADALRASGGVVNTHVQDLIKQRAATLDIIPALQNAGVEYEQLYRAVSSGGTALESTARQIMATGNAWDGATLAASTMSGALQEQGGLWNNLAAAGLGGVNMLISAADYLGIVDTSAGQAAIGVNQMSEEFKRAEEISRQLSAAQAEFASQATATEMAAQQSRLETASWAAAYKVLTEDTKTAAEATKAVAGAFGLASDQARNMLVSQIGLAEATANFKESLNGLDTSLIDANGNIDVMRQGGVELGTTFLNAATSLDQTYGATLKFTSSIGEAAAKTAQARQNFIDMAVAAGFPRANVEALADSIMKIPERVTTDIQTPGAVEAAARALDLGNKITSIPDSKSIIVESLDQQARASLESLGLMVVQLPNGQILVTADPSSAIGTLGDVVQTMNNSKGTIIIEGNADPATGKITQAVQLADGSKGTITVDGNADPVTGKITGAVTFANGSTGTITIDGNQTPAQGKVTAVIRYADGSVGTVLINANDQATPVLNRLNGMQTSSTHTVTIRQVGTIPGMGGIAGAQGGIVQAMRDGGVLGMARGSYAGLTPMSGAIAQIVKPNTWRVIGDRVKDNEAYIPINRTARSRAILEATANAMGFGLQDKISNINIPRPEVNISVPRQAQDRTALIVSETQAAVARRLDALIELLERRGAGATVNVQGASGDPTAIARSTVLALRMT
jgi:hypothetical protein